MEDMTGALEEERMKTQLTEEKYTKAMEINDILNKKIDEMQGEMLGLQQTFQKVLTEEDGTKEKIKQLITTLQDQLTISSKQVEQKTKENQDLITIINVRFSGSTYRSAIQSNCRGNEGGKCSPFIEQIAPGRKYGRNQNGR